MRSKSNNVEVHVFENFHAELLLGLYTMIFFDLSLNLRALTMTHVYHTYASSLVWTSHLVEPKYRLQRESPDRKKIHARIKVFMKSTKILYRRKEPKSTLASLFRSIGGLMGVYLGYSSLHIFHVLDVLVDGAWSSLSRILARRNRTREARREFHSQTLADGHVLTRYQ
ncbi:amiloride-sensitive sodium channel subunit alpha [Ixodes scapularis]